MTPGNLSPRKTTPALTSKDGLRLLRTVPSTSDHAAPKAAAAGNLMTETLAFPTLPVPAAQGGKIGLLSGKGNFPIEFARAAKAAGHDVYCMGVEGLVPPELADHCAEFRTAPLMKLGRAIRFFKRHKVRRIVMAGKIEKRVLFEPP